MVPSLFIGFLCLQVSSVSNFHPDTRGRKWSLISAHLFSSVVRKKGHYKYHCRVWGVLAVYGPHWFCHSPRQRVFPRSPLLRLQGALQGHCPKWTLWFLAFPRSKPLRFSGTLQGNRPHWMYILCPSQVQAAQTPRSLANALSQVGRVS